MQRALLIGLLALALKSPEALTAFIINNTDKACAVVFVRQGLKSPQVILEKGERISEEKAFSPSDDKDSAKLISCRSPDAIFAFEINVDNLPPSSEISLGSPLSPESIATTDQESTSSFSKVGTIFSSGLYYLGSLISSPFGILLGMDIGAKAGTSVGLHYLTPQLASSLPGLANILLGPVLPAWAGHAGATGGWILGGATGAIVAPIVFISVWKGSAWLLTHAFRPKTKTELTKFQALEEGWLLVSDEGIILPQETQLLEQLSSSVALVQNEPFEEVQQ